MVDGVWGRSRQIVMGSRIVLGVGLSSYGNKSFANQTSSQGIIKTPFFASLNNISTSQAMRSPFMYHFNSFRALPMIE